MNKLFTSQVGLQTSSQKSVGPQVKPDVWHSSNGDGEGRRVGVGEVEESWQHTRDR